MKRFTPWDVGKAIVVGALVASVFGARRPPEPAPETDKPIAAMNCKEQQARGRELLDEARRTNDPRAAAIEDRLKHIRSNCQD
jgi:hypothetical protein